MHTNKKDPQRGRKQFNRVVYIMISRIIQIKKIPRGDGNLLFFLLNNMLFTIQIKKIPRGDGNIIKPVIASAIIYTNKKDPQRGRKPFRKTGLLSRLL